MPYLLMLAWVSTMITMWDYDKVFGEMLIKSEPPHERDASLGPAGPRLAAAMVQLPAGATPAPLHLLIGAIALLLAGALVLWSRRAA